MLLKLQLVSLGLVRVIVGNVIPGDNKIYGQYDSQNDGYGKTEEGNTRYSFNALETLSAFLSSTGLAVQTNSTYAAMILQSGSTSSRTA